MQVSYKVHVQSSVLNFKIRPATSNSSHLLRPGVTPKLLDRMHYYFLKMHYYFSSVSKYKIETAMVNPWESEAWGGLLQC